MTRKPLPGIRVATVRGTHEYVVESALVVDPITCYPFYFVGAAPTRFVVHARPLTSHT